MIRKEIRLLDLVFKAESFSIGVGKSLEHPCEMARELDH